MSVKCIDPFAGGEEAIFFSGHGILDLSRSAFVCCVQLNRVVKRTMERWQSMMTCSSIGLLTSGGPFFCSNADKPDACTAMARLGKCPNTA